MYVVRDKEGEGESTKIRGNGKSLTKQTSEPRGGRTKARIIAFLSLYFGFPKEKPPVVQRLGVLVQFPSNTPKSIFVCCFVVMMDPLGRKMVNKKRETKSKANPVHHNERSQIGNEIRKR